MERDSFPQTFLPCGCQPDVQSSHSWLTLLFASIASATSISINQSTVCAKITRVRVFIYNSFIYSFIQQTCYQYFVLWRFTCTKTNVLLSLRLPTPLLLPLLLLKVCYWRCSDTYCIMQQGVSPFGSMEMFQFLALVFIPIVLLSLSLLFFVPSSLFLSSLEMDQPSFSLSWSAWKLPVRVILLRWPPNYSNILIYSFHLRSTIYFDNLAFNFHQLLCLLQFISYLHFNNGAKRGRIGQYQSNWKWIFNDFNFSLERFGFFFDNWTSNRLITYWIYPLENCKA